MIDEEKLIEDLRVLSKKGDKESNEFADKEMYELANIRRHGAGCFRDAIEIVNNQPKIGEWIPCNERLPEEGKDVLVWYEYFRFGEYNRMF